MAGSYVPHGSLRTIIPDQPWTRSRRSYRGDIDNRPATLLFKKLRYNGRRAKVDAFDVDVEAFVEVGFSNL